MGKIRYVGLVALMGVMLHFSFCYNPLTAAQRLPDQPGDRGILAQVNDALAQPHAFVEDHLELLQLLGCLLHLPYIWAADSKRPEVIKLTALLAGSSTSAKVVYELLRKQNAITGKIILWDGPKLAGYSLSVLYDIMRFIDASNIALKNKESAQKMTSFKINQAMQLLVEGGLRLLSYLSALQARHGGENTFGRYASEFADVVAIWRLNSRFNTYFKLSKLEANVNFVVRKEEPEEEPVSDLTFEDVALVDSFVEAQKIPSLHPAAVSQEPPGAR